MNRQPQLTQKPRPGFTLVELLVAIAIIGILMAIAIPAINGAITRARITQQKLEVDNLARAVEQYLQKYGDYPPDGSDLAVMQRHMRRIFPRMTTPDTTLMERLVDNSTNQTAGTFSAAAMDRSEALVFFLGGFSSDIQHPLTGEGGPLEFKDYQGNGDLADIRNYQYNATRSNALFEFDQARLTMSRANDTAPMLSTDETLMNNTLPAFGGADLLPAYAASADNPSPILYFDSRTYGVIDEASTPMVYNGYLAGNGDFGGVRPYKTSLNAEVFTAPNSTVPAKEREKLSFSGVKFHNPDTYQIISPGSDGIYGACVSTVPGTGNEGASPTVHFITETGQAVAPIISPWPTTTDGYLFTHAQLGSKGFQDQQWSSSITVSGHLDNITNFSTSTLESDLQ